MKCDQLLHGRERYSVANCYMGGRGEVQPTVTWEGEVKCDQLLQGGNGEVRLTVTWEGEVKYDQPLHGRERLTKCNN